MAEWIERPISSRSSSTPETYPADTLRTMPALVLGPLLRYVGETEAVIWVETDGPCEVEVLGTRERTFCVCDHHYALVCCGGLERGAWHQYEVELDGERVWPLNDGFPASAFRPYPKEGSLEVVFGSCRLAAPHVPPYSLRKDEDPRGREIDALHTLAQDMRNRPREEWPDVLLMLGDQVYADEVSPAARAFLESRRDPSEPPGERVLDFDEYAVLYRESWADPTIRWLLSTLSTAMIFDDHDVHDDWNISEAWLEEFARRADQEASGARWSYARDLGRTRLVVIDSRAGRVLEEGNRSMLDENEWAWVEEQVTGDFDHVLVATSLPWLLGPGMHYAEAWSEAVARGPWGPVFRPLAEKARQTGDLEHWAAFQESFARLAELLRSVAAGERGPAPASVVVLSGDVHHAYLYEVAFRRGSGVRSSVYQAVCSPYRNPLGSKERRVIRIGMSRGLEAFTRALARSAGVADPDVRWRMIGDGPGFDNQVATLAIDGRRIAMRLDKAVPVDSSSARLDRVLDHRLA